MANPRGINQYTKGGGKSGSPSQRKEVAVALKEYKRLRSSAQSINKRAGHGASVGGIYVGGLRTAAHEKVMKLRSAYGIPKKYVTTEGKRIHALFSGSNYLKPKASDRPSPRSLGYRK